MDCRRLTVTGNALTYFQNLKNPIEDYYGKRHDKTVYVVVFQEGGVLREKITKICDSFMGERFEVPHGGFLAKINEIEQKINETKGVMAYTKSEIRSYLETINRLEDQDDVSAI